LGEELCEDVSEIYSDEELVKPEASRCKTALAMVLASVAAWLLNAVAR
jgi:hypothetical protein